MDSRQHRRDTPGPNSRRANPDSVLPGRALINHEGHKGAQRRSSEDSYFLELQRGILLFIVRDGAEHLGQSIAYARFAGVVPPWSEDGQKKSEKKEPVSKDKQ
jgi:hypothetical protein